MSAKEQRKPYFLTLQYRAVLKISWKFDLIYLWIDKQLVKLQALDGAAKPSTECANSKPL